jgi:hypothetical protein
MGFNINKFKSAPIAAEFDKDGEKLHLWIDADIVTPNFLREIREMVKRENEDQDDLDANTENALYMAKILSQIIARWDAENNGIAIAPTFEFFVSMPLLMLGELFSFTMNCLAPKKTTDSESEDII